MKLASFLLLTTLTLAACSESRPPATKPTSTETAATPPAPAETPMVGGDQDAHGCKASAGYTWSQLRGECIRLFETGRRLNPVQPAGTEATLSAFVVPGADKTRLELFLPRQAQSTLLTQAADEQYQAGPYRFDARGGVLYISGTAQYKAAP